jgi:hypothetical protein
MGARARWQSLMAELRPYRAVLWTLAGSAAALTLMYLLATWWSVRYA